MVERGMIDLRGAAIGEVRGAQSFPKPQRETIFLTPVKKKRKKPKSKILRVITSPKTTLALLGTLAAIPLGAAALGARAAAGVGARVIGKKAVTGLGRGVLAVGKKIIPKTPIGIGATILTTGALVTSPTARKAVVTLPKTLFVGGKKIGEKIEGLPSGVKEKAGKFGLIGLGAAALGAGLLVAPTALKAAKGLIPSFPKKEKVAVSPPVALLPAPPSITPTTAPVGAVEKPIEEKELVAAAPVAMPSIKITNKPQTNIDISFRKSRRFINQQVIVK